MVKPIALMCGHVVRYSDPYPKGNEAVTCLRCDGPSHVAPSWLQRIILARYEGRHRAA